MCFLQVLTGKRSNIITVIREVEAAQQEDEWLTAYEADEQRYKVWCIQGKSELYLFAPVNLLLAAAQLTL